MATNSLTDNDVLSLAEIFDFTLQYYCTHSSSLEDEYFKKLSTIMGLGFTTILVDGDLLVIYERHLQTFIRSRNFKAYPGYSKVLSYAITEVINGAIPLFPLIDYPKYYDTFVAEVESATNHIIVQESGKLEEAKRLMQILFSERY